MNITTDTLHPDTIAYATDCAKVFLNLSMLWGGLAQPDSLSVVEPALQWLKNYQPLADLQVTAQLLDMYEAEIDALSGESAQFPDIAQILQIMNAVVNALSPDLILDADSE